MIVAFAATFLELLTQLRHELLQEKSPCRRAQIYLEIGNLYSAFGDFDKALENFSKARFLAKKNSCSLYEEAFYREIVALTSLQRYEESLQRIKKFVKLFPYSEWKPWVYFEAARCYYGMSQYREAVANLKIIAITYPEHPAMPDILLLLGDSLKNMGRCTEAFVNYFRIVRDFPEASAARQAEDRTRLLKKTFPDRYSYFLRRKGELLSAWKFYYLQAGSFVSQESALKVRELLSRLGYPVHIEPVEIGGKTFHRVIVGPLVSEGEVKEAVSKISFLLKMKPVVLRE